MGTCTFRVLWFWQDWITTQGMAASASDICSCLIKLQTWRYVIVQHNAQGGSLAAHLHSGKSLAG